MYRFKRDFDLQRFSLAATTSRNPDSVPTSDGLAPMGFPLSPGTTYPTNVGDILIYDTTNIGHRPPTDQADMATYVGIAESQSPVQSLGDLPNSLTVRRFGLVWLYATNGETYNPYDTVYFNELVSVQTVVKSTNSGARTVAVGYYYPSNQQIVRAGGTNSGSNLSFTATAVGQLIQVWLTPYYPGATRYPAI